MNNLLKILTIIIALSLLAGCSQKGYVGADLRGENGSGYYEKHELVLPDEDVVIKLVSRYDQSVALFGYGKDGSAHLYKFDLSTEKLDVINCEITESVNSICMTDSGSIGLVTYRPIEDSQDLDYTYLEISNEGAEAARFSLNFLLENESTAINGIKFSPNGLVINMINRVVVIKDEKIIESFDYRGDRGTLANSADGRVFICGLHSDGYVVDELLSDNSLDTHTLEYNYTGAFSGAQDGICLSDANCIYIVDYKTGDRETIAGTTANGINTGSLVLLSESSFLTLQDGKVFIWKPGEDGDGTTVLKLATYKPDITLWQAVTDFNNQSDDYKIEIIDYSAYDSGENSGAGLTKLNTEIISGYVPDIFDLAQLPGSNYISKGLLEDIQPYLSSNGLLEGLVHSVKDTLTQDGKIYDFVPSFRVFAVIGDSETIGEGLLLSTLMDVARRGALPEYLTREELIKIYLASLNSEHLDLSTFDESGLSQLLEISATLPAEAEISAESYSQLYSEKYSRLTSGQQMLDFATISEPVTQWQLYDSLFSHKAAYSGFPSGETKNGLALEPALRLAMSSKNKQGVWEFFNFLLTEDYQNMLSRFDSFPIMEEALRSELNEQVNRYQQQPLRMVLPDGMGDMTIDCPAPEDSLTDEIMDVIAKIDRVFDCNATLYEIIIDEASAYFSGQRGLDETVELIQSRTQLYISERKG